ncbi:MAG TPA: DUF4349 domain-containing protein [Candidatus Baltobacteraceae bacterium]
MRWLAAAGIALIVVLAIASAGWRSITMRNGDMTLKGGVQYERVSVLKRAPMLKLSVRNSAVSAAQSQTGASLDAPQIARTGKVDLYVGDVTKSAGAIARLARGEGGDVFSSDIAAGDGDAQPAGNMEIRVPAERFDAAMNAVVQAGKVRERSTGAQDLTSDLTDADARLRNLRQTETDIRAIMNRSGSVSEVMDAENQLSQVREQIETLEAQIKSMRRQVAYATIDITLTAEAAAAPVQPTAAAQLASAWHGAVAALSQMTVGLLAALLWCAVFVPYALAAGALAWFIYVRARARAAA